MANLGGSDKKSNLLEGYIYFGVKIPKRFIISIATIVLVKTLMAFFVYYWLNLGVTDSFWMTPSWANSGAQNDVLWQNPYQAQSWEYLFLGWDSAWYLSIIAKSYSFSLQSFAFFPGLPFISSFINLILANPVSSLLIVTLVSGIAWVPLFQNISEHYMEKDLALISTLIFALSPFTSLFSTVAYAEGLFLLLSLASWWLSLQNRFLEATIFATLSAATRPVGLLLALPIFLKAINTRRIKHFSKKFVILIAPILGYFSAWVNGWLVTGNFYAIVMVDDWNTMYSFLTFITKIFPNYLLDSFSMITRYLTVHPLLLPFVILFLILTPIMGVYLIRIDRELAVYCLAYYLGILVFGAILSIPRYLSFIFPLWLSPIISKKITRNRLLIPYFVLSVVITIMLWLGFINGIFVG
jgi:Gpi18-like mannosyltransferase